MAPPSRLWALLLASAVFGAACTSGGAEAESVGAALPEPAEHSTSTVIEDYPDAIVRELRRQMRAPRPVPNSAMPPRHLDVERFPELLVDRYLIVSGGQPPDRIRSIDEPTWLSPIEVDWLADDESVLVVEGAESTHIYPTQILLWHEIVNDEVDDVPVTVTYCPLCNSAVAYDRRVGDQVLDFGTSGALFHSALVMYDRQTESLWTHFDGRSVVGDLMGEQLEFVAVQTVSWSDAAQRWPEALVLDRPAGDLGRRPYGTNPYPSYEGLDEPLPGFFQGELDPRLPSRQRIVGLFIDGEAVAIDRGDIESLETATLKIGDYTIRLEHTPGVRSPLDGRAVAEGADIGSVSATQITAGASEEAVPVLDTFWFAWAAYYPDTDVVDLDEPAEP
jgi:hypothetical protein